MQEPQVNIIKSWRKTISMRFDDSGVLQIKAPHFFSQRQIYSFLEKNTPWIEKHFQTLQERKKEGEKYYLFGGEWTPSSNLWKSWAGINPSVIKTWASRRALESFYRQKAREYIEPRCIEIATENGFHYSSLRITSAMTRWGSCSSKKTLNFSYRLVMAPKDCIDYVIVHELCHLREMNHSHRFWKHVAQIMPDYKEKEKHLKDFWWRYKI